MAYLTKGRRISENRYAVVFILREGGEKLSSYERPAGKSTLKWPYPVRYGEEKEVSADVLILGGGIAGCHAAINAAKRGAKVIVVDKGPVIRSGSGGAGVDHWGQAITNPCCKITPEEKIEITMRGEDSKA